MDALPQPPEPPRRTTPAPSLMDRVLDLIVSPELPDEVRRRLRTEHALLDSATGERRQEILRYLELVAAIPWLREPRGWRDLRDVERAVDLELRRHQGARAAGSAFVQHAALRSFLQRPRLRTHSGRARGTTLLLVGPPGVGKTRLAEELARAAGTGFAKVGLGGRSDANTLRGFSRTYARSRPSVISTALVRAGRRDSVVLLDEIDKLGRAPHDGRPTDTLLEILDGRSEFRDDHLDLALPLQEICWIATANDLLEVPEPLRDRMEVIHVTGFTRLERERLVVERLWPQVLADLGLGNGSCAPPAERIVLHASAARLLSAGAGLRDAEGLRTTERRLYDLLAALSAGLPDALENVLLRNDFKPLQIDGETVADLMPELRRHLD